ncbi:MAG: hypothetical protein KDA87_21865 [Planctomycetales bacterium]|nr:hypothetical protein [Planctomycetales bacterium]
MMRRFMLAMAVISSLLVIVPDTLEGGCFLRRHRHGCAVRQVYVQPKAVCPNGYQGTWDARYPNEGPLDGITVVSMTPGGKIRSVSGTKLNSDGTLYSQWGSLDGPFDCDGNMRFSFRYNEWLADGTQRQGTMVFGFLGTEVQGVYRLDNATGNWKHIRLTNRTD